MNKDPSVLQNANQQSLVYIELQDILMKVNDENHKISLRNLENSIFFRSKAHLNIFVHNIIVATHYRSKQIPAISKLVSAVISRWKDDENYSDFSNKFLSLFIKQLLHRFSFRKSFLTNMSFLYYLYVHNVFSLNKIIEQLDSMFYAPFKQTRNSESGSSSTPLYLTCFLSFFGYHIEKDRNDIFQKYMNSLSEAKAPQCYSSENIEYYFFKELQELKEDDWRLWKKKLGENQQISDVFDAIRKDDDNILQKYSAEPGFDYNQRVMPTIFEPSLFLLDSEPACPTLLQLAALHGSINCFKFLKINGADPGLLDKKKRPLLHYAVAFGDAEITRMIEQNDQETSDDLIQLAIEFHHFELYKWLFEKHFQISGQQNAEDFQEKMLPLLLAAASVDNVKVIIDLFNKNVSAIEPDNFGWTALHYAAENGHFEVVQLLLMQPSINVNAQDEKGWAPIHRAVMNGHYNVLKLLRNCKGINMNIKNYSGISF